MGPTRGLLDRLTGSAAPAGPASPAPAGGGSGGIERPITGAVSRQWSTPGLAARLPAEARAKYLRLTAAQEDIGTLIRGLSDQRSAVVQERMRAETYLSRLQSSPAGSGRGHTVSPYMTGAPFGEIENRSPASADQLAVAEADVLAARDKIAAFDARIAEKTALRSRLPDNIGRWLEDLPSAVKLEIHRPAGAARKPAAKPPTIADIETARGRIAELRAEVHTIRSAPPPSADVKARARAMVLSLAERGTPDYRGAIQFGRNPKFPDLQTQTQVATAVGVGISMSSAPDMLALFCWLNSDAIIQKMEAEIGELSNDEGSMSDGRKTQRIAELEAEILETERSEEAAIEQLELSGAPTRRRDDATPIAALGIELKGATT